MSSLTPAQDEIYRIIKGRAGLVTSMGDIVKARQKGARDRTSTYRKIQELIEKKLVERYDSFYYRLPEKKKKK